MNYSNVVNAGFIMPNQPSTVVTSTGGAIATDSSLRDAIAQFKTANANLYAILLALLASGNGVTLAKADVMLAADFIKQSESSDLE